MKNLLIIVLTGLVLLSCKKKIYHSFTDEENKRLIGEWNWVYTNNIDFCSQNVEVKRFLPTKTDTYKMKFLRKGKINLYKNGKKIDNERITFANSHTNSSSGNFYFKIYYATESIYGLLTQSDSLIIDSFYPFTDEDDCIYKDNYFIK